MLYTIYPRNENIRFLQLTTDIRSVHDAGYLVGLQSFYYDKYQKSRIVGIADQPTAYEIKEWVFDWWFEGHDTAASINMLVNTEWVTSSAKAPRNDYKVLSMHLHGGIPFCHFDSSVIASETGIRWKNGMRFENIPLAFSSKDILFFDGTNVSVSRFRLLNWEEAGQLVDFCELRAKHITEKEMLHKLDEIEENYTRWYYERLEERKEWVLEHRCKIDDVIDIEIDDFDRLLHGFPFVDRDELMFAELTGFRSSN